MNRRVSLRCRILLFVPAISAWMWSILSTITSQNIVLFQETPEQTLASWYGHTTSTAKRNRTSPSSVVGGGSPIGADDDMPQKVDSDELLLTRRNKTLVVLLGNLRGGEEAWHSLYRHVLDVNQADLAILTAGLTPPVYRNASLFQRSKYVWNVPHYKDWADAFDLVNGTAWREKLLPIYDKAPDNMVLGPVSGHPGSGAIIFMLRWFLSQRIKEHGLLKKYDRFIVTRNDHFYVCGHNISTMDEQYMWVPEGQDWGGITDRHLVSSNKHVLQALNILPPILQDPSRYRALLSAQDFNTEQLVLERWRQEGLHLETTVRRFGRVMFTCSIPGDALGWRNASQRVLAEGVFSKYPLEYRKSRRTCWERLKND
jgi:hypothetical protein